MDPEFFKPRLLFGETKQGYMTTQYVPVKRSVKIPIHRLKERLQVSETNPKSLNHLVPLGLDKRFPDECGIWAKEVSAIGSAYQKNIDAQQKKAQDKLSEARAQTESSIRDERTLEFPD